MRVINRSFWLNLKDGICDYPTELLEFAVGLVKLGGYIIVAAIVFLMFYFVTLGIMSIVYLLN